MGIYTAKKYFPNQLLLSLCNCISGPNKMMYLLSDWLEERATTPLYMGNYFFIICLFVA